MEKPKKVVDPVCGMHIHAEKAAATRLHAGTTYHFCTQACEKQFVADPSLYAVG